MTQTDKDTFDVTELYLLAAAFDAEALFGLPDKKLYQLQGEEPWSQAYAKLKNKGVFDKEGSLTKSGGVIIKTLYTYFFSQKYVRINNLMFAFKEKEAEEVIILAETADKTYKLYVMDKPLVLKLLGEKIPLLNREPVEAEKNFLQRELSAEDREAIKELDVTNDIVNIELFHPRVKPQISTNPNHYQQWLVLSKEDRLIMIDTTQKQYYQASQYWFLKVLFDALDFPYRQKVGLR
ncbi:MULTISPECIES: DUF5081 family protein [Terribacillus]|jgi:Domain of unknown function (DUF5081)|uniref:DUF5081 domain-containing protein n=1 Tax=Terribacillus saccharophilus TaxID=361277 RepID=A0ABX4H3J6_9BACI|nr:MULTISPECIES: DUF5081 family protein [Terribacillus]PAD34195.1 hypothetical protein CHH56_16095 [Terribacillus saccharophilus]PAD98079.1 hypothetical protein CHH50_00455 [Terribacillus saccharophilus]PAE01721.1 hypothetical protein CHH48_00455 [Terribacillus saccharophilus]VVM31674.1 SAV0291 homolog within ESAT-6 gene cluster [Terribacillus sp. AE2B 122]